MGSPEFCVDRSQVLGVSEKEQKPATSIEEACCFATQILIDRSGRLSGHPRRETRGKNTHNDQHEDFGAAAGLLIGIPHVQNTT